MMFLAADRNEPLLCVHQSSIVAVDARYRVVYSPEVEAEFNRLRARIAGLEAENARLTRQLGRDPDIVAQLEKAFDAGNGVELVRPLVQCANCGALRHTDVQPKCPQGCEVAGKT
jgi:hypothetical protein